MLLQALNRSYYSTFHATRALLALDKFDSKKHSGIISYFNKEYISTKIPDKSFSKILMGAERIRNHSDYDDFYIVPVDIVKKQIKNADILEKAIKSLIKARLT